MYENIAFITARSVWNDQASYDRLKRTAALKYFLPDSNPVNTCARMKLNKDMLSVVLRSDPERLSDDYGLTAQMLQQAVKDINDIVKAVTHGKVPSDPLGWAFEHSVKRPDSLFKRLWVPLIAQTYVEPWRALFNRASDHIQSNVNGCWDLLGWLSAMSRRTSSHITKITSEPGRVLSQGDISSKKQDRFELSKGDISSSDRYIETLVLDDVWKELMKHSDIVEPVTRFDKNAMFMMSDSLRLRNIFVLLLLMYYTDSRQLDISRVVK